MEDNCKYDLRSLIINSLEGWKGGKYKEHSIPYDDMEDSILLSCFTTMCIDDVSKQCGLSYGMRDLVIEKIKSLIKKLRNDMVYIKDPDRDLTPLTNNELLDMLIDLKHIEISSFS